MPNVLFSVDLGADSAKCVLKGQSGERTVHLIPSFVAVGGGEELYGEEASYHGDRVKAKSLTYSAKLRSKIKDPLPDIYNGKEDQLLEGFLRHVMESVRECLHPGEQITAVVVTVPYFLAGLTNSFTGEPNASILTRYERIVRKGCGLENVRVHVTLEAEAALEFYRTRGKDQAQATIIDIGGSTLVSLSIYCCDLH